MTSGATTLVDSHTHLDMCGDPSVTLMAARAAGVQHILTVGFDLNSSRLSVDLAGKHQEVSAAVGIHPHDAAIVDDAVIAELATLASDPAVVAIGETGLDYYRDRSPRSRQKESFIRHLELARELNLTVMVHSRDAAADTLELLQTHARGLRVVLHCFALHDHLDQCLESNYFMSIAGNVTFPKAAELRHSARLIPDHLILTETDAPWLTPVPYRGKQNSPEKVRFVLKELALLRQTQADELATHVLANFHSAFPSR
ncbi:MAG: TatD family hydrolase [Thermoleophilia bacterium]